MEGFPKRALWALVGCVVGLGAVNWAAALAAASTTPWLEALPGETVVGGLGPVALGDVLTGVVVAALVGGAALLAALGRRPVWIPAVATWVVAPPIAARIHGADFAVPVTLGHWHELFFAHLDLGVDALLAATWLVAVLEMVVVTAPAIWFTLRRRPALPDLGLATALLIGVAGLDVWLAEGLVAGPLGLVAGVAGLSGVGWLVALALVGWSVAAGGPTGLLAAVGGVRALRGRHVGTSASSTVQEQS